MSEPLGEMVTRNNNKNIEKIPIADSTADDVLLTSGSAARTVLVSRASRSALASYRKVTTCRCLCCAGSVLYLRTICLPLHDDPASRPQGRVLGA